MKISELLNEAATGDIVEIKEPYAADTKSDQKDDLAAAKFAWKFKCMSACVQRIGPSGGWPEYVFWGPRENIMKLVRATAGPDHGMDDKELYGGIKKSRRPYEPKSPVDARKDRHGGFKAAAEAAYKELTGPRGSQVHDLEVDSTGVNLTMAYDFAEHRPKLADLKKLVKPFGGNVRSGKNQQSSRVQPLFDYVFDFDDLTPEEVRTMKIIFNNKHKK